MSQLTSLRANWTSWSVSVERLTGRLRGVLDLTVHFAGSAGWTHRSTPWASTASPQGTHPARSAHHHQGEQPCHPGPSDSSPSAPRSSAHRSPPSPPPRPTATDGSRGAVYVLGNQTGGNEVIAYSRGSRRAAPAGRHTTPPVARAPARAWVRRRPWRSTPTAATCMPSTPARTRSPPSTSPAHGLRWRSTVPSGGDRPISVSVRGHRVYALNAGGTGNVSGFSTRDGALRPLAGSTRALSGDATDPAQVAISPDGRPPGGDREGDQPHRRLPARRRGQSLRTTRPTPRPAPCRSASRSPRRATSRSPRPARALPPPIASATTA